MMTFTWHPLDETPRKRVVLADDDPALPRAKLLGRLSQRGNRARKQENARLLALGQPSLPPLHGGRPTSLEPGLTTLKERKRKADAAASLVGIDLQLVDFATLLGQATRDEHAVAAVASAVSTPRVTEGVCCPLM